jgi:Na+/H+ antiporter NhaC
MASACDHMAHVKTQMPYALTVGGVAILVGFIPSGFGFSPWISLILGAAALFMVLKVFGKSVDLDQN